LRDAFGYLFGLTLPRCINDENVRHGIIRRACKPNAIAMRRYGPRARNSNPTNSTDLRTAPIGQQKMRSADRFDALDSRLMGAGLAG
jgi:hypothetical protein